MNIEAKQVNYVKGDKIMVLEEKRPEKAGSFYVPDNYRDNKNRKACWKAKVLKFGDKIDFSYWKPYTVSVGETVLIDPVAIYCPSFKEGDDRIIFIRQEDIFGVVR